MKKYNVPINFTKENEETHENELPESFYDLILEVAAYGKQNLAKARELNSGLPKHSNLVFLQMTQAESFYNKLEKNNFNVFHRNARKMFWPSIVYNMVKCAKKGIY